MSCIITSHSVTWYKIIKGSSETAHDMPMYSQLQSQAPAELLCCSVLTANVNYARQSIVVCALVRLDMGK